MVVRRGRLEEEAVVVSAEERDRRVLAALRSAGVVVRSKTFSRVIGLRYRERRVKAASSCCRVCR